MKKSIIVFFTVFLFANLGYASKDLDSLVLLTRHGTRAGFQNINNADFHWSKNDLQQLTPIGMSQAFNFGCEIKKTYIDDLKLLPEAYSNGSIYTLSSDFQRTIVTAQCVLMGLYPPGTGPELSSDKPALPYASQPIPIRTLPYGNSNMIQGDLDVPVELMNKYFYSTVLWKNKIKEIQPKYAQWSEALGNKIEKYNEVVGMGDTLNSLKANGYTLPKQLSKSDAQEIIDFDSFFLFEQYKPIELAYYKNHELFNRILQNLQDRSNAASDYKMVYYSGHDLTILGIMSLLGSPLNEQPKFVANIEIELYKDTDSNYSVKVRYNQKYIKLSFAGNQEECSLDDFVKYVNNLNQKYKYLLKPNK